MPNWDIFHSDRLEVERNLAEAAVRDGMAQGEIVAEDLARPAGSGEPWVRLSVHPRLARLLTGGSEPQARPARQADPSSIRSMLDEDDDDGAIDEVDESDAPPRGNVLRTGSEKIPSTPPLPSGVRKATTEDLDPVGFPDAYDRDLDLSLRDPRHVVTLDRDDDDIDEYDPEAEDEEAAEFTFTRSGAETVEELDLAAMVDVAFQLVLFFLVTASTIIFKALEVPRPKTEAGAGAAVQTTGVSQKDAEKDYILVEIDANGAVKIDHENGPNDFNGLVAKLRDVRERTKRTGMLVKAESSTKHRSVVNAYDAANEVSLEIATANVKPSAEKPPVPPPAPKSP